MNVGAGSGHVTADRRNGCFSGIAVAMGSDFAAEVRGEGVDSTGGALVNRSSCVKL